MASKAPTGARPVPSLSFRAAHPRSGMTYSVLIGF